MKFVSPLIVVCDIEKSKAFYKRILGLDVILDFGANVTLTGGIALQTRATYANFINQSSDFIKFNGCDAELYFEEDSFDEFIERLSTFDDIEFVHNVVTHSWGQRVVRFYDPDRHIIEVGEAMSVVSSIRECPLRKRLAQWTSPLATLRQ